MSRRNVGEAEMMHAVVRVLYFHAISLYEGNDARNDRKTASRLQGFRHPVCLHIYIKHIVCRCVYDKRGGVSLYYVETRDMTNSFKI